MGGIRLTGLRVDQLTASFGPHEVLHGLDLDLGAGGLHAILGPSGCGKTTLLRCIAGLKEPDAGRILLDGHDVTRDPPERRGIVLLHQENTLFPHLNVADNVAFGLRFHGTSGGDRRARAADLLRQVGLEGLDARHVDTLSGGQRQRVALARALAVNPRVLLLDEPLSHVDEPRRVSLRGELRRILHAAGATVCYVTHDREEALAMGDQLILLDAGRVIDHGTPRRVHDSPANDHAARLLGRQNIYAYERDESSTRTPLGDLMLSLPPGAPPQGTLMLREEEIRIVPAPPGANLKVSSVEFLGRRHRIVAERPGARVVAEQDAADGLAVGAEVRLDTSRAGPVVWPT